MHDFEYNIAIFVLFHMNNYRFGFPIADHVVFVSKWLQNIYLNLGMNRDKTSVIMSGSDNSIFNSKYR